jgi:hypothetical protein
MAYVAVSRGAFNAQIFTNDRGGLAEALSRDVSDESARKARSGQRATGKTAARFKVSSRNKAKMEILAQLRFKSGGSDCLLSD